MSSILEAIQKRISIRTYADQSIEEETKNELRAFLKDNQGGPFGNRVRFHLLDLAGIDPSEIRDLGTYGVIKGAKLFIAGAVKKGIRAMEDFGYAMEKNILKATELGLGTCWLGGTLNRGGFAARMNIAEDELLPAISPLGYPKDRRSLTDWLFRLMAGSKSRKPWEELFFMQNSSSPLSKQKAGIYACLLEMVRLAPSASNKQPWRIVQEENSFHFFLKRNKGYGRVFQKVSLQDIDMGIAMSHFELSAKELNLSGKWQGRQLDITAEDWEYIASWESEVEGGGVGNYLAKR